MLNDDGDGQNKKSAKKLFCTKCKGSEYYSNDDLRKHFKSNWHNFNAKQSAQGKESFTMEEFDEYSLMNPDALK